MDLKIAVVCSSNQNRSMEAHKFLSKKGFNVKSYGSGNQVKLPGASPNQPNVYSFQTTYDEMYKDLLRKDRQLYNLFHWRKWRSGRSLMEMWEQDDVI